MTKNAIALSLVLLFATTISFTRCQYVGPGVEGNGQISKETRNISSFDQIEVSGGFTVILTQGLTENVEIEADENLFDLITTEVRGGVLDISSKENIKGSRDVKIYVEVKDLTRVQLSGAVDLRSGNDLTFDRLAINGSGASSLDLTLQVTSLEAELSGANDITLVGKAKDFYAKLSGASDLKSFDFEVNNAEIKVTGAGDARVSASETLKVNISGAGSVTYKGDPRIEQNISGAGSLKKSQ